MPASILSASAFALASLLAASSAREHPAQGAAEATPVLVELFTSEGCSSCPPADALLARLERGQPVPGARVIALGEHVDYWDDLGWKDSFSSPLFTERQQEYVQELGLAGPYTPQLVVGGQAQAVGSDELAARSAIARVARSPSGRVALRIAAGAGAEATSTVVIEATWRGGEADVVAALVEDRATTRVSRGENAGRTLAHVSAVRSMVKVGRAVGTFTGRAVLDTRGVHGPAHAVVFVQESKGGRVYAAESVAVPVPRAPSGP